MEYKRDLSAKKSLGQNFLKSKKAIDAMVTSAAVTAENVVIEIGPGKGVLTKSLLETGATVIAYELDPRMVEYLSEIFADAIASGQLTIVHKDILELDIEAELGKHKHYKVIANIPYYITNAIIRKFLSGTHQPTDMVLLVQKEVAERIVVRDGKESLLSLSIALYGTPRYIMKVHKKYFSPSPKIDSAIVHIGNISRQHLAEHQDEKLFFDIIHAGFGQKRKMLLNNIAALGDKDIWREIFIGLGIPENIRAENVHLDVWLQILQEAKKRLSL